MPILSKEPLKNHYVVKAFKTSNGNMLFNPRHWIRENDTDEYILLKMKKKQGNLTRDSIRATFDEFSQIQSKLNHLWTFDLHNQFYDILDLFNCYFLAAWDRLPPALLRLMPTVDDLKAHFFEMARKTLILRGLKNHPLVTKPYNMEADVVRRQQIEAEMTNASRLFEDEARIKMILAEAKIRRDSIEAELKEARRIAGVSQHHNATAALEKRRKTRLLNGVGNGGLPTHISENASFAFFADPLNGLSLAPNFQGLAHLAAQEVLPLQDASDELSDMLKMSFVKYGLNPCGPLVPTSEAATEFNKLVAALCTLGTQKIKYHNLIVQALESDEFGDLLEDKIISVADVVETMPGCVKLKDAKAKTKGKPKGRSKAKGKSKKGDDDSDY